MECLTKDQLVLLRDLKKGGVYRDSRTSAYFKHERYRTHENVLFSVLKTYLVFKGWDKTFKSRHFNKRYFSDCPLSCGEVRGAIRYGNRMGLLCVVSGREDNRSYKLVEE